MAAQPQYREWNQEPPDYGNDPHLFTVEFEHNGFFYGLRGSLTYVSGTTEYFDYCYSETFSLLNLEEFLHLLDYEYDGRLHIYWLQAGKDFTDGVHCLENERDLEEMVSTAVEEGRVSVLVDHANLLANFRPDMINRPGVAGTTGGGGTTGAANANLNMTSAAGKEKVVEGEEVVVSEVIEADDSDSDSDFEDSDNEIADGDDDLFVDNVDREVEDNNDVEDNFELKNEQALDDTDLSLREEEQERIQSKFKVFNPLVDMENPVFKAGMVFSSVQLLREALASYSVRNRVKIVKVKNDLRRVDAICKPGCPWFLKATIDSRKEGSFTVRKYCGKHACKGQWAVESLTAPFLAKKFIDEVRDNQKIDLTTFAAKVQREFNLCPNRWTLSRARRIALDNIHGDEDGQFAKLWDYGQELRRSNPGSTFFLSTNRVPGIGNEPPKEHLATLYWSYGPCKRGFLRGCRPFICVDGCHIKTKYKGILLTAVGVDPNNCIYPIAMGLVEVECTSSWEWFLTTLKEDLNISNTSPFTIMSDKQKGLINAVQKIWPDAEHRFCVRHLYQNFQKAGHKGEVLKNNLWTIARSTNIAKWQQNLDKMQADSTEAYDWVQNLAPNTWIKAFFSDFPKCDLLLNNHCEVFNSYILEAREMPILSMLDTIFYKTMQRVDTKQKEAQKMKGTICPKIQKIIDKYTEWSLGAIVKHSGNGVYHVRTLEFERHYTVDFPTRSCDCRRWQLSGIPCHHAIACCRLDRLDVDELVHSCYSINTYKEAYAYNLIPLRGRVMWEKTNGVQVLPPLYTKVMGRPRKNRKKAPEEKEKNGAKYVTRAGTTMHCSICGEADHNKKGHYKHVQT